MQTCVATVIEKTTNIATSVLHQLSIKEAIICACPVASYYGLESLKSPCKRNSFLDWFDILRLATVKLLCK